MDSFLDNLPKGEHDSSYMIDLRNWQDPDAPGSLSSIVELEIRSADLFDELVAADWDAPVSAELVEKAIKLVAAAGQVGLATDVVEEKRRVWNIIKMWRASLRTWGYPIFTPFIWVEAGES